MYSKKTQDTKLRDSFLPPHSDECQDECQGEIGRDSQQAKYVYSERFPDGKSTIKDHLKHHHAVVEFLDALPSPSNVCLFRQWFYGTAYSGEVDRLLKELETLSAHLRYFRDAIYYNAIEMCEITTAGENKCSTAGK
jgi:hypothetical protein